MSIYLNNVGEILRVYTQQVKSRHSEETAFGNKDEGSKEAVSFSMTLQQRQRLERLALEKMNDLTRRDSRSTLSAKEKLNASHNLFSQLNDE